MSDGLITAADISFSNKLAPYRYAYDCYNDCVMRGCPGHVATATYSSPTDSVTFDFGDGGASICLDPPRLAIIQDYLDRLSGRNERMEGLQHENASFRAALEDATRHDDGWNFHDCKDCRCGFCDGASIARALGRTPSCNCTPRTGLDVMLVCPEFVSNIATYANTPDESPDA